MEENKENLQMPDPNEIHINVKRNDTDQDLFDSDCCSVMTMVLTADGRLATSFFGLHTPEIVKAMKKITNQYYAKLIKEFKRQYKEEKERIKGIKVLKDKNPEITDEALMKLADDLREMERQQEKDAATELEENKAEKNRPACLCEEKKEVVKKSTSKKTTSSSKTGSKKTTKTSSKKSSK